jgi:hypothetical protein
MSFMHAPENTDPTLATVEAVDVSLPVAGIGSRSYAFIIDWHIRFIAAAAWYWCRRWRSISSITRCWSR